MINPQITIRNETVLWLFGFYKAENATKMSAGQPLSLWVKCIWWRIKNINYHARNFDKRLESV